MPFNEHQVLLCLNKELYLGFIDIQSDRRLGRAYAGLLPYVEGLYRLGYISKEIYEKNFKEYSIPLNSNSKEPEAINEDKRQKTAFENADKTIKAMIAQFEQHTKDPLWFAKAGRYAKMFEDKLDSARALLSLIKDRDATVQ